MKIYFLVVLLLSATVCQAQNLTTATILSELKKDIISADEDSSVLITNTGLNVFLQRKTLSYLTGVSDLSLAKFYASVSTESEKLNLGFNIPVKYSDNSLLLLINPIVESDVKNSFATLYKNDKWQGNIRAGLKITYLLPFGTMNFNTKPNGLYAVRKTKYEEIEKAYNQEEDLRTKGVISLGQKSMPAENTIQRQSELLKKQRDAFEKVGVAEADYIEQHKSYNSMQYGWFSLWGFVPVSEATKYISPDYSTAFEAKRFKLWEINLQYTHLWQSSRYGSLYLSPWIRRFQNNAANADLMTNVSYEQYRQLPGTNQTNLALIESNPAFVGNYGEFMTTNLNIQMVYMAPFTQTLIKPGLSVRYEKNWGDFSPQNWRFGLPLSIQGKTTPINIELQYRINDVNNYKNEADHKPKDVFGVSVGLPFVLLYK